MRKWIFAVLLLLLLTGCGDKNELTLGQYKGLSYTPVSVSVEDSEIEAQLDRIVNLCTTYREDTDRDGTAVETADLLLLDYTGILTETGESFEGGSDTDYRLTIGSGKAVDGFEDALLGATVGDTVTFTLTVPEDYTADTEAAGKEAEFTVTVKAVLEAVVPELDDSLISDYTDGEYTSLSYYRDYLKSVLTEEKEEEAREEITSELLNTAYSNTVFTKIDEDSVDEYYDQLYSYYETLAGYCGTTLETYVSANFDETVSEFEDTLKSIAEETVREQLMLDAIIEAESISLSDEDYERLLADYMEDYGYTDRDAFEEDYTVESLKQSMLYDLAVEFIYENAVPAE